jgi:putative nucleotidyltransferase with HDIG domain
MTMGSRTNTGMPRPHVSTLETWFTEYVKGFKSGNCDRDANVVLKEEHSNRVRTEIAALGEALGLNPEELWLADALALLHDVGRFEQYARYGTFLDARSTDHAILGAGILREHDVLAETDPSVRELILRVVSHHNRAEIPKDFTDTPLLFLRLLRDADKLDLWRVVTDYYHNGHAMRNDALELGLPDSPDISDEVLEDLTAERAVGIQHVRTLNDFKVLQMGWVHDVNFAPTFHAVRQRRYLDLIRDALPRSTKTSAAYSLASVYLERKCNQCPTR